MTNVNQAEFEGKVAIVTGAASGIGRATTTLPPLIVLAIISTKMSLVN